jgi:hypothetical protein
MWFTLRAEHNSYRTEQAYDNWMPRFTLFHGKRHPQEMGDAEIEASNSIPVDDQGRTVISL